MAFFKFRLPGQTAEPQGNFSQPASESVEAMRRRARHRLIGACVLVFIGVVVFPLIFDTQPRPVSVDIAIDIPDRAHSKPINANSSANASTSANSSASASANSNAASSSNVSASAPSAPTNPKPLDTAAALDAKEEVVKTVAKTETKAEAKPETKATDTKDAPRFIVQVGAFSDEAKLREVRAKVEKSGFKTYTHVADTKEGKRTRVRVGPFASREEADKVANKIKQLQLQPQVLTL
jgi:DedD protein